MTSFLENRTSPCALQEIAPSFIERGSMFRIALLMDHPSPHMVGLIDALAQHTDYSAQIVYFRPGAPERRWGDPAGNLPYRFAAATKSSIALLNMPAVIRAMTRVRADIWVVNTIYTAPETWAAVAWLNAAGLPWVYMNEPFRPRGRVSKIKNTLLRLMLRRAAGAIGMGREAKARYADLVGSAKPSVSIPYYLNLDEFLNHPIPAAPTKTAPVRFVTAAQMIGRKGIDVLLAACNRLPKAGWSLTVAGDGPLRIALEQAFRHRWGPEQVRFLGEIPYAQRAAIFADQHVFVFPSRWDGWGMAPVEAMAAGLPVISTDQVMSMREFVREDENGYLIPSEDPTALAERMCRFLTHPERIPVMGRAARAALANYRPEVGAKRLLDFLAGVDWTVRCASARGNRNLRTGLNEDTPTWQALTEPAQINRRFRQHGRALAKLAVIEAALALPRQRTVPRSHRILVYHLVLREDRKRFEQHLTFLLDHYRLVTVRELVQGLGQRNESPLAAITFDDGFRVLMSDALELLEKHSIKVTFFVPTGFIDSGLDPSRAAEYSLRAHYYRRPLAPMSIDDLRQLQGLGHEIGSHGVSHLGLNAVSRALAASELEKSRAQLTTWLGTAPIGFAYPYGDFDSSVGEPPRWAAAAGYRYAVTTRRGAVNAGADLMRLPREHVEGYWRVRDLRYFLSR
jgi:glycosyltransferase involved in cell wall biosynthesis/peptidoglycan/xylan/chitin deacetylase (PgdA/CDA1 family)